MNTTDTKSQYSSPAGAGNSAPSQEPMLQAQDPTIAQLKARLDDTNPNCSGEEHDQVLNKLHHATGGSDDGLELADGWRRQRDDYQGTAETVSMWYAIKYEADDPVADAISSTDPDAESCHEVIKQDDEQSTETPPSPSLPLDKYSLKGLRSQLLQDAVRQAYALEPIALMGQATAVFGAPGTGKTLLIQYLAGNAISQGHIDPAKLYYFNADDSHAGLLEKLEYAEQFGYHTIAEGHQGFSTGQFLKILDDLIANNQAHGVIIILDTGKKFFDPMSKRQGRAFGKHVRQFVMKGGTIIVLAHTNKYRDSEGKPIYAGTSDIVEDFDCAYLMYESGFDVDAEFKTIRFENIKSRGNVARQASFHYSIAEGLSYREILESVESVDDTELPSLQHLAELKSDVEAIDAVIASISDGINTKMILAETVAERSGISKRAALRLIDKYSGSDPDKHRWNFQVHERGAKKYYLLNPITAGNDPVS